MIDRMAWVMVRLLGLIMTTLGELIGMFYHPSPVKDYEGFSFLISLQMMGGMMFYSESPEDMPKMISERMLFLGKMMLLIVLFELIMTIIKKM